MKMARWNLTGLALFGLILNSGLTQAANSITGMTPNPVRPGQMVTLHGQFNVANFRSRQYRIVVTKKIAPRPQGTINGVVDSFRVTPTSAMMRIPRTWRGKSVYPGNYLVGIKDMAHNRWVFFGENVLLVRSGARTAPEVAKKTILNQNKMAQQRRLGGNIGRAVSPRTSFGRGDLGVGMTREVPQMKLTLKDMVVGNRRNLLRSGVSIGDNVTVLLSVQNLGAVAGRVKVGYMSSTLINASPKVTTDGFVTVAPGRTVPMLLNVRITTRNLDRNINHGEWNPVFRLLTTSNATYRDSYMADNTVVRNGIYLKPKQDLAITRIKSVSLKNTYLGGGQWDDGTTHPISLAFIVKVKNNGLQTSRPTRLSVAVMGKRSVIVDALRDPKLVRHSVGRCVGGWPKCTMNQDVSIPAIAAGQTSTIRVQFNRIIPHQIVQSKRHHIKVAIGPYICSGKGLYPGKASITAFIGQADVDEAPSFRWNNRLILTGSFGSSAAFGRDRTVNVCGIESTKVTRR